MSTATPSSAAFDGIAESFADYGTTVRGYVRYKISRQNLQPYIDVPALSVLDIGGGSGADAVWLAEIGHTVLMVEPSIDQRRLAERRCNFFLDDASRARLSIVEDLSESSKAEQFDLVLVHAVAMYQPDATSFLLRALNSVKPGGIISIVEKNYYGTELRDIRQQDFINLQGLHTTGRSINHLNRSVYPFKPEELEALLTDHKFDVLEWSGIRLVSDELAMSIEKLPEKLLKDILEIEHTHGHHPAIRGHGQMLHFIARRN